jgi:hypothetical protein
MRLEQTATCPIESKVKRKKISCDTVGTMGRRRSSDMTGPPHGRDLDIEWCSLKLRDLCDHCFAVMINYGSKRGEVRGEARRGRRRTGVKNAIFEDIEIEEMRRGLAMLVPGLSIYGLRLKRATDG